MPRDHADAVATAILQMVSTELTKRLRPEPANVAGVHAQAAAYLRDVYPDNPPQAVAEWDGLLLEEESACPHRRRQDRGREELKGKLLDQAKSSRGASQAAALLALDGTAGERWLAAIVELARELSAKQAATAAELRRANEKLDELERHGR